MRSRLHARFALLCVPLALAGCATSTGPDASHAPLVCDAAREGEVAFLFHESVAFFGPYQPHGARLLAIEGSCRYHVYDFSRAPGGTLRTGALTPDEVDALNEDLLTAPWSALDGTRVEPVTAADAPTLTLRREAYEAQCYPDCSTHAELTALAQASGEWTRALWDRGAPVEGPLELDGEPWTSPERPASTVAWSGHTELASLFPGPGYARRVRVEDAEDVASLRALRAAAGTVCCGSPLVLEQGGAIFRVGAADVLPYDVFLYGDRTVPWNG